MYREKVLGFFGADKVRIPHQNNPLIHISQASPLVWEIFYVSQKAVHNLRL